MDFPAWKVSSNRLTLPASAPGISDIVAAMPDSEHAAVAYVPPGGKVAGIVKLFDLRTPPRDPSKPAPFLLR